MIFSDTDFEVYNCYDKPYLDIKKAESYLENDQIKFTLELYSNLRDSKNLRYEFQGWFNDYPEIYLKFNYFLTYSNKIANITYDNNTVINVTNYSFVSGNILSIVLPISFFPDISKQIGKNHCSKCGTKIEKSQTFCYSCGTYLNDEYVK